MPQDFPLELIEETLQHLYDDKQSLRVCSLVCSSWTSISHRCLFDTFYIDENDDPARTCPAFLNLLDHSPHLASYFRSLDIIFGLPYPYVGASRIEEVGCLPVLLSRFTNVSRLSIDAHEKEWLSLPHSLLHSLRPILSNPNLKCLAIQGPAFSVNGTELVDFLSRCSGSLRVLKLDSIALSQDISSDARYSSATAALSGLEELELMTCALDGDFKKGAISMPCLRKHHQSIIISPSIKPSCIIPSFVPASLSELFVQAVCSHGDDVRYHIPDFTAYPNLRYLDFAMSPVCDPQRETMLSFVGDVLTTLSANLLPRLEYINVTMNTKLDLQSRGCLEGRAWENVGQAVRELSSAGRLRYMKMTFTILAGDDSRIPLESFKHQLIEYLGVPCGDLLDKKTLVIAFTTVYPNVPRFSD